MAKIKDLLHSFLYETAEEEEDEENEPVSVTPAVVEPVKEPETPVSSAPLNTPVSPFDKLDKTPDYIKPDTVQSGEATVENTLTLLTVDELDEPVQKPAKKVRKTSRLNRDTAHRPGLRRPGAQEYVAVLSPIFGNLKEDEKQHESVHNAINLPAPDVQFELTQVISPMYGKSEAEQEAARAESEAAVQALNTTVSPMAASSSLADFLTKEPVRSGSDKK